MPPGGDSKQRHFDSHEQSIEPSVVGVRGELAGQVVIAETQRHFELHELSTEDLGGFQVFITTARPAGIGCCFS